MSRADLPRRVRALSQFRVDDLASLTLTPDDEHHLRRVLRAREGEEIVLTDGRGGYRFATVTSSSYEPASEIGQDDPLLDTTLYIAPLKGDRSENVVVKATELGVTRVVPLTSRFVAVKFRGEARDKALARWRRVAREAMGQCRRTWDLVIEDPVEVSGVPRDVAVADFGGTATLEGVRAIAIGPEGGWEHDEWPSEQPRVSLGDHVLRGDTAAIAAATLLVSRGAGWSRHARDT